MFLIHSMQLHGVMLARSGSNPAGTQRLAFCKVSFGYRAIESEVAPGVGYLIVIELNDDGAAFAGFRVHEIANVFHGYHSLTLVQLC